MLDLSAYSQKQINQLYHPTAFYKVESQKMIYSRGNLNITEFVQILLKEWFYLVKKGGLMIIDYKPNKICDKENLEQMMERLWRGSYKIISHEFVDKDLLRFVCKKFVSTKISGDDITKWTFGIITNGKRIEWIEQIIKSIRIQRIPHYEIIICGTYPKKIDKDIRYIPFNQKDEKGWITRKKNLIVKKASFENICMLHDRIALGKDFYQGMKKWGNCFENLGCRQLFERKRVNDWLTSHYFVASKEGRNFSFESYVDYRDWYPNIFFLGQLNIFKKSIITKNNLWWNETLFYGEKEDYYFSKNLNDHGFIHRFNEFSSVTTLTNKYINPTWIKYSAESLIPHMNLNNKNAFLKVVTYLVLKVLNIINIRLSIGVLENMRGKIYTFLLMFTPGKYFYNREWKEVSK